MICEKTKIKLVFCKIRLVKAKHPDEGIGSEINFVELLEAKEFLMNFLKLNNQEVIFDNEEETIARMEYEEANIEINNVESVIVFIPTVHI